MRNTAISILAGLAGLFAADGVDAQAMTAADRAVPRYAHIFVVFEENKNYAQIMDPAAAPNIAGLAARPSQVARFIAARHNHVHRPSWTPERPSAASVSQRMHCSIFDRRRPVPEARARPPLQHLPPVRHSRCLTRNSHPTAACSTWTTTAVRALRDRRHHTAQPG